MTSELEAATRAYRRAQNAVEKRREALAEAVCKAAHDGVRQVDICRITGYTRERVRQIVKAGHDARSNEPSDA